MLSVFRVRTRWGRSNPMESEFRQGAKRAKRTAIEQFLPPNYRLYS